MDQPSRLPRHRPARACHTAGTKSKAPTAGRLKSAQLSPTLSPGHCSIAVRHAFLCATARSSTLGKPSSTLEGACVTPAVTPSGNPHKRRRRGDLSTRLHPRLRGHRVEAPWLGLSCRPHRPMAQDEEPGGTCRPPRARHRLGEAVTCRRSRRLGRSKGDVIHGSRRLVACPLTSEMKRNGLVRSAKERGRRSCRQRP